MDGRPTRDDAWALLTQFTDNPSLIKHALAVEAAMRAYARRYGESEEEWGAIGLIHDFDYQQNPTVETHLHVGTAILRERGWPEEWVRTVVSHADYMGVPRETLAAKTLFAVDELAGFLTACALVRPDRSIAEVQVASVKKKLKDKAFARSVNREDIVRGAEELGVDLAAHIEVVRDAMATIAEQLELPPPGQGTGSGI
jgi:putative nucleotidyltransferase with HDIG domain